MNLPRFSVHRPVFTTMVTLIIVLLGAVSLSRLKIDLLPSVELPTVSVSTSYEGASPEVMERLVTQPLEEIVATVPGVEEITSQSSEGRSRLRITFGWGTKIDTAALDVQSRIEAEINELPDNVTRPRVSKFDLDSFPVVILGVSSPLDPVTFTELVEDEISHRFSRIPGVAQVDIWGGYNREVRVELDPDRIRALGVSMNTIINGLRNANLDLPAGKIEQGQYNVTLRAPAEFDSIEAIRSTVISSRGGATITIDQIANVHDTYERITRHVRINRERGLRFGIRKQSDANTVEVAERILATIDEVNAAFPQVEVVPIVNQGNFIERSIANVAQSVLYGGVLAILVLLLFLRNLRSTLVISLSIPISVVATFALIYFGGFTLNLMTLGGLALGVGMMVDSSVVVLENIFRRRVEDHEGAETAAVEGTREVGHAIIASTITTLVIFLPLIFVQGVSGVLFRELAYVIMFALICSLLVSLSLVPMLASKLLRSPEELAAKRPAWVNIFVRAGDGFFNELDTMYRDFLRLVLKNRLFTVILALVIFGSTLMLYPKIGKEFLPPSDEGVVNVTGEMAIGTKLDVIDAQTRKMEQIVYDNVPEAIALAASASTGGGRADTAEGSVRLSLTPASQRLRSNTEIAEDLREKLTGKIAGMQIRTRAPQGQFILQRLLGGDDGVTVEVRGFNLQNLEALASRVVEAVADVPGITDVDMPQQAGVPQLDIQIDRDKVADLGLSPRDITEMIETAIAGSRAGDYRAQGYSHRILVQLMNVERLDIETILDLTLATPDGRQVALRNLVEVSPGRGPLLINRKEQQRVIEVTANVEGRDLGSVAADIQVRLDQIARPEGYSLLISGKFEEQQKSARELMTSLVLALILVYMVLACQYESLRDPIIVMVSVPMAATGVLIILFLTNSTFNLQSYIGCIMLGGIVVNNAILLVDQAGQLSRGGMPVKEAVAEAGRRRLRPILMTTLTTILALVPLAFGIGEGADAQAPLARAVIGGLIGSTFITLVLIPTVYSLFHPDRRSTTEEPV